MKYIPTVLLFCGFSFQLLAQSGQIVSIYVDPSNPTVNDEITVYAELTFPNSGCPLDYHAFALQNSTISATAHHCVGLLAAICNTTDTFELGQMAAGAYTFDLTLTSGGGGPNCSPGIIPDDNDQLQFEVSNSVGIDDIEKLHALIFPNPTTDIIHLTNQLHSRAVMVNGVGSVVGTIERGIKSFDVTHLPSGMYFIISDNLRYRFIKQ
jgi:hypothetical protein